VALVRWTIATAAAFGALNATAPRPVPNADFARALGRAMHRPAFMPAPAFALRLLLGEMADALLLSGQNAVPAKATRGGFQFRYTDVDAALRAIFARPRA
jgi:NAD dependent epimerase/dehydratase family enzyme